MRFSTLLVPRTPWKLSLLLQVPLWVLLVRQPCRAYNMNEGGIPYQISNPVRSHPYSADFEHSVRGSVEHFDVYGEVQTVYSQVYWTRNEPINLPPALVERFQNKVLAITGYEVDQVVVRKDEPDPRKTVTDPSTGGNLGGFSCFPDCSEGDKSVPSYHAYNHHYFSWLVSSHAEVYDQIKSDDESAVPLPNPTTTRVGLDKHSNYTGAYPTSIVFKENPGGEFRKSYHGYPSGFAQLLYSPKQWIVEPMQIDTHNRNSSNLTDDTVGHVEWFLPQRLQNNMTEKNGLSPLIECPCTDRITKETVKRSPILTTGTCETEIQDEGNCQAAVQLTGANILETKIIQDPSRPEGCLLVPAGSGAYKVLYNAANVSGISCGGGTKASTTSLAGSSNLGGLFQLAVQHEGVGNATLTLAGPENVWFGVGFGAKSMSDQPYALIVDGLGKVTERRLANHGPGNVLPPSLYVLSNTVDEESHVRTVVLSRPIVVDDDSNRYFAFPKEAGDIDVIAAVGNTVDLAYHEKRMAGIKVTLLPTSQEACVCAPKSYTYLSYMNSMTQEYRVDCLDEPRSNMLRHGDGTGRPVPNAACNLSTYHGGLRCCKHGFLLTDKAQEKLIPKDQVDKYYLKWRYYFQEYRPAAATGAIGLRSGANHQSLSASRFTHELLDAASHQHLHHWVFLIDSNVNDYEEDNRKYGTASVGRLTAHLQAKDMGLEDVPETPYDEIIPLVMTPHCHAPSCIREELWNADTNQILCNVTARYGSSEFGSTNAVFNEANYIAIPPCIFGHQPGLEKPFHLDPTTNLVAIKYFNNSYRHLGQMAQWTGMMVYGNVDPLAKESSESSG